jgi:predicted AAA+ superfamily ATPase
MVRQVLDGRASAFVAADQPLQEENLDATVSVLPGTKPTPEWLITQWTRARTRAKAMPKGLYYILAIDEIQKIPRWSEIIKGLWDADRAEGLSLHVVLLGSSPWLMQRSLTESLAGRYEAISMSHWSYVEMQEAFDFSLEEYIYFGGYPGSAPLIQNERRWRHYVRDALIRPNIEHDILQMTRVDKPSLLNALFELGSAAYSGQILSMTKIIGNLQDAGNTVTLSHYLDLLSHAGLLTGLQKYAGHAHRRMASPPKFNVHNTALMSALGNYSFSEAKHDRSYWGRLVESAVGSHLINTKPEDSELYYWRESPHEVDFVFKKGQKLLAIEVKSGLDFSRPKGLAAFVQHFSEAQSMIVGEDGVALHDFLSRPVDSWFE